MKGQVEIFPTPAAFREAAAEKIVTVLQEQIVNHKVASVALAGGTTPRGIYELLGSKKYRDRITWRYVHLFWGDERCVAPTMPESNFRMVKESLLGKISIPSRNIHRIQGELNPEEAARVQERDIRRSFSLKEGEFPRFTLVLLGLGEDGHTASLFPGTEVLGERERIVSGVYVQSLAGFRVTLTVPAINHAGTVLFLVSGKSKAGMFREVLEGTELRYPAQYINPAPGQLFWFADADAASLIGKAHTA